MYGNHNACKGTKEIYGKEKRERVRRVSVVEVEDLESQWHVLSRMTVICDHCGAKRFQEETKTICCGDGWQSRSLGAYYVYLYLPLFFLSV